MSHHTLKIASPRYREKAHQWVEAIPEGGVIRFYPEPTRSMVQNDKMWAMLGDISKQVEHAGMNHTPETWKAIFMNALGHETRFATGLNGEPFPVGFRSSQLTVRQMADLIELMYQRGAEWGVKWSERGFE